MSSRAQASSSRNRNLRNRPAQSSSPRPPPGHVHLVLLRRKNPFYLEVPTAIVATLCRRPRKYLRYLGWCILGVIGHLQNEQGIQIPLNGELDDQHIYYYIVPGRNVLAHAVDLEVIKQQTQIPSETTRTRLNFRTAVLERDGRCVWTGSRKGVGMHIIPYARGDEWLQRIVENRPHDEDLGLLTINDIRNGVYASSTIHDWFDPREVVVLKTPNPILRTTDVPPRHQRNITNLNVSYPRNSRYTIQWITPAEEVDLNTIPNNNDATFTNQDLPKPLDLLLHYNYGAAVVKHWGKNTNVLSNRPDIPRPKVPAPVLKAMPDRTINIRKRAAAMSQSQQASGSKRRRNNGKMAAGDAGEVQDKWDEHDVMLYFWGNSEAALKRHSRKKRERTVGVENWRVDVRGNPDFL